MSFTQVKVPDIGDFKDVPVIEVLVKPGDRVREEQSLITLESDKASMEIPSTVAGVIKDVLVKVGDKVSEGSPILAVEAEAVEAQAEAPGKAAPAGAPAEAAPAQALAEAAPAETAPVAAVSEAAPAASAPQEAAPAAALQPDRSAPEPEPPVQASDIGKLPLASPSVRREARLLDVPLDRVKGSGKGGRILLEDVQNFVKEALARPATGSGTAFDLPAWPKVDFEKYGPIERKPLSHIKKISGANLHRNWVTIPHVTNTEDADITELEALRVQLNAEQAKAKTGVKFTLLSFLIKASVTALKKFPEFNASLEEDELVFKHYYNIGFAADTPNGLVVPVVQNADTKSLTELAEETAALAARARAGKLGPAEMSGGTFTISSLGGIGGTYFTPIINAPEVAILGVCRSATRPIWDGESFAPRLILPLSLSYDHRVIDGALAARFNIFLAAVLADFRRVSL